VAVDVSYDEILDRITHRGYKQTDLDECIQQYQDLNILAINQKRTKIRFVEDEL